MYILSVKIAITFTFVLLLVGSAPVQAQHKLDADGKQALPYVKIAADVAGNVQQNSLNNFTAVFISYRDSDQAKQDDDLAPFMTIKQAEPAGGRSTVCLFSAKKDSAICVYFSEKKPFGIVAAKAGPNGKLADIAAGYRPVSPDMLARSERKVHFEEITVTTDTGAGLTGFHITTE